MGYAKKSNVSKEQQDKTSVKEHRHRHSVRWYIGGFLIVAAVLMCYRGCNAVKKNVDVIGDGDADIHLKQFLGYEFGKVYAFSDSVMKEPWFGFREVFLTDYDAPLISMTFRKTVLSLQGSDEVRELAETFSKKYQITFKGIHKDGYISIWYDGTKTRITITQSVSKKDKSYSDLMLEITDQKMWNDHMDKHDKEMKKKRQVDFDRMEKSK